MLYFFITSNFPSGFNRYSSFSEVDVVESSTISSGKSVNVTLIIVSKSFLAEQFLFTSDLSILIIPLPSLKNNSSASSTVDFPISFLPTKTVKSSNFILV